MCLKSLSLSGYLGSFDRENVGIALYANHCIFAFFSSTCVSDDFEIVREGYSTTVSGSATGLHGSRFY